MRASVSAFVDLSTEAHAVTLTDAQRCVARKNGLVEHVPAFFCQLTHTLYPRDNANLILAGHAWLGERVHGHGLQHGFASIRGAKFSTAPANFFDQCVTWRKICLICEAMSH